MANHKKQQFCKKGHDKNVTGALDGGRCKVCRDESNRARPKQEETPEQKAVRAERQRKSRAENPEKARAYDIKYYHLYPEKYKAKSRAYTLAHKDDPKVPLTEEKRQEMKVYRASRRELDTAYRASRKHVQDAYNKQYYIDHREELIAACLKYYDEHREEISEKARAKNKANPEKKRLANKVAKQNRRDGIGELTAEIVERVWEEGDGMCAYCLDPVSLNKDHDNHWRLEHCTPISRGGTHFLNNLVVACKDCNSHKYMDTVLEHCLPWKMVTYRYDFFAPGFLNEKESAKLTHLKNKYKGKKGRAPSCKIK